MKMVRADTQQTKRMPENRTKRKPENDKKRRPMPPQWGFRRSDPNPGPEYGLENWTGN